MRHGGLHRHLTNWLGQWPARVHGLQVVASDLRAEPGWDGAVRPAIGVSTANAGVLSVIPRYAAAVRDLVDADGEALLAGLPTAVGRPGAGAYRAVFRWTVAPVDLPDVGVWVPADHPVVPDWLRVFSGDVLVGLEPGTGRYLASVGIKRHDRYGHELAVGIEPAARQRGGADWPGAWLPRRPAASSTTAPFPPICTIGPTSPRPGWPRRPVFPMSAGRLSASATRPERCPPPPVDATGGMAAPAGVAGRTVSGRRWLVG